MRLLYCSRDYTTHDLRFVRTFVSAGIEVHYLRLESDGVPYVGDPLPSGAHWISWRGGGAPRPTPQAVAEYLPAFASVVASLQPNLIHAGPVQSLGLMAALTRTAPTVLVSWGSDLLVESERDAWYRWASETALGHADALVCDSAAVLECARRLGGGTVPRHLCIPWGPDVLSPDRDPEGRLALRRERGWEDAVVVVATRAWHPGYRVPDLVDAFARAATRVPGLRLALAGAGSDAAEVEARISRHGLGQMVYRPGVLAARELHHLLEASDIYLALVPSDGTSIALLEAMGHRLPVIVPANAGNREWVEDGVSGYLVPPTEVHAWSDRIISLAADPARRDEMGLVGQTQVRARADWSRNAPRLVELYGAAATEGARRGRDAL
jgi:glycosyltransferase involved in cell wall biosynthesis